MPIEFYKLTAAGNDFILLFNFPKSKNLPSLAKKICNRHYGVGADGLLLLNKDNNCFNLLYLNSDGSYAFCGNGTRASAFFIYRVLKIRHNFDIKTSAGKLLCRVEKDKIFVEMPSPSFLKKISLNEISVFDEGYYIFTGTNHLVIITDDIKSIDVVSVGRVLRYHKLFKPHGVNVNFVEVIKRNKVFTARIRTYEKGVEEETLSCASGITSAFYVFKNVYKIDNAIFITKNNEKIFLQTKDNKLFISGPVEIICKGEFYK